MGSPAAAASLDGALAVAHREPSLIEGLAGDHPGQVDEPQRPQCLEVADGTDPARVEEAAAHGVGHAPDLVEIRSLEHAVAIDVRVHESRGALLLETAD